MNQGQQNTDYQFFMNGLPYSQSLPGGVQLPGNVDGENARLALGTFRQRLQEGYGKTFVHVLAFRLISENGFQNSVFATWLNNLVNTLYLISNDAGQPIAAIRDQVVQDCYTAYLGYVATLVAQKHPNDYRSLPAEIFQAMEQAAQKYNNLCNMLNNPQAYFQSRRQQGNIHNGGGGGVGYGMMNVHSGYQQTQNAVQQRHGSRLPPVQQHAVSAPAAPQPTPEVTMTQPTVDTTVSAGTTYDPSAGLVLGKGRAKAQGPSGPTQRFGSVPANPPAPAQSVEQPAATAVADSLDITELSAAVPAAATEVPQKNPEPIELIPITSKTSTDKLMSDNFNMTYTANDFGYHSDLLYDYVDTDRENPFSEIRLVGATAESSVISGWASQWGPTEHQRYRDAVDNQKFHKFMVKYRNGVILEKVMEMPVEMQYYRHELDKKLQLIYTPSRGTIVPSSPMFRRLLEEKPVGLEEIIHRVEQDDDVSINNLPPIHIPSVLTEMTDLAAEVEAIRIAKEALGGGDIDELPRIYFYTAQVHPLFMADGTAKLLNDHVNIETLPQLAKTLRNAVETGRLPVRSAKFLNDRLTKALNATLKNRLAIEWLRADNFIADIENIYTALTENGGRDGSERIPKLLDSHVDYFLKVVHVDEFDEHYEADNNTEEVIKRHAVEDVYLNCITEMTYDEIASLGLDEGPLAVSEALHPRLYGLLLEVKGITDNPPEGIPENVVPRVITADGEYLYPIMSWIVKGTLLITK